MNERRVRGQGIEIRVGRSGEFRICIPSRLRNDRIQYEHNERSKIRMSQMFREQNNLPKK